jgi:hypothetical protein
LGGLNQGTNTNILIQNNTMTNIGPLTEAAMVSDRNTGCPNGVVFRNNHINTAQTDGFAPRGADCGTQWIGNEIENIQQSNCPGHCDGFQDKGGSVNQVIDGNYFHNVVNCGLTNDGTFNMTYKNNVCIPSSESIYAMQWTGNGMTFIHNTIIGNSNTPILIGNTSSGQSTNFIEKDNIFSGGGQFVLNPGQTIGGTGWQDDYNLCNPACSGGTGLTHNITGSPTFSGGSSPTTYAGFALTGGSLGHLAADDGTDIGIGVGVQAGPVVSLGLSSIVFQPQQVGTTSTPSTVTLTNTGNATLNFTSIQIAGTNPGDFAFGAGMTCPTGAGTLAAGNSCTISLTFTPAAPGARSGQVNIADDAAGSPQSISLSGTGGIPIASVNPGSLAFGSQNVNTTSVGRAITLQNTGTAALAVTTISITGTDSNDYFQSNNCPVGSNLGIGSSCTITVTFTPVTAGTQNNAQLSIADNASGSPHTVAFTGTGVQGGFSFGISTGVTLRGNATIR